LAVRENNVTKASAKLGITGALMIVFGAVLFGLFVLSNKGVYFFSNLAPYTIGFFITSLIASTLGFLLISPKLDRKTTDNVTKSRAVLSLVSVLYLILIGYIMSIDQEWTIQPLIIGDFAFYYEFTVSSYSAFFATLLTFGILVLPFILAETGVLDESPDEQPKELEAEQSFDRFTVYLKRRFGAIQKIKNYTLPIAVTFLILGSCLTGLPYFMIKDGPLTWDPKTEIWFIKDYKGYIRGQLLLAGILFLAIGLVLILLLRRSKKQAKKGE
jgi:hypothetical protein